MNLDENAIRGLTIGLLQFDVENPYPMQLCCPIFRTLLQVIIFFYKTWNTPLGI